MAEMKPLPKVVKKLLPPNNPQIKCFIMAEGDTLSVSVVIPARNAEGTLPTAVESILAQTVGDFELILVNHASSDATGVIMTEFARRDSRVQVAECTGDFIEAVNLAWQLAGGDLIARMDADDFAYPTRIERQRNYLAAHPNVVCCASLVRILKKDHLSGDISQPDEGYAEYEKWINSVTGPDQIARERFIDSPLPNPATMIRRDVLEEFGGYQNPVWAEDYDLWLRLLHADHALGKVTDVLLDWFDGYSRVTRNSVRYSQENFQRAKAHYLSLLPRVKEQGVAICGAGPTGKAISRLLLREGIRIHAFFEVNERQIGNRIGNIPVRDSAEVTGLHGKCVLISAVGLRGARQKVRDLACPGGYVEGEDFFCVA